MRIRSILAAGAAAALLVTGCGSTTTPTGTALAQKPSEPTTTGTPAAKLNVVVAFYPLQFIAEKVGGELVKVTNLTTPGSEPHDLELRPQQIASLGTADLVIYQKGFQAQVDAAVDQQKPKNIIDTAALVTLLKAEDGHDHDKKEDGKDDHDHNGLDPHIWLDPHNMVTIADAIGAKLATVDGVDKAKLTTATEALRKELEGLDAQYKSGLANCKIKEFITSHEAFGYLARRHGLTQIGISGLSPDAEPSPARVAEVQKLAKEHKVTTIFYETLVSPAVAKSIAGDLNLRTDVLDPLEGITKDSRGTNYIEVMNSNLTALKTANECS